MDRADVLNALNWLWVALTSPTSTWLQTLLSGAIGAAAGSLATQGLLNRQERLNRARAELNAANHAMNVGFVILNQYLAFKRQMVRPMVDAFATLDGNTRRALNSSIKGQIAFDADLKILPRPEPPVDHLDRLVLEKISMGGRGLSAALQLRGVTNALQTALAERTGLINEIKEGEFGGMQLAQLYLGLESERGADTRFRDNVRAISLYTDDSIFFAHLTIQDIRKHAVKLLKIHGRRLGSTRRDVPVFDLIDASKDLLPSDENYSAWLNGFRDAQPWWSFWRKTRTGTQGAQ